MPTHQCHQSRIIEMFHISFLFFLIGGLVRLHTLVNRLVGNLWLVGFGWSFTLALNPLTNGINKGFGKHIVWVMEVGTVAGRRPMAVPKTCVCADMEVTSSEKISAFALTKIIDSYSLKDRPKEFPPKQAGHRCCKMRAHRPGVRDSLGLCVGPRTVGVCILLCASSALVSRGSEAEEVGESEVIG